MKSGVIAVLSLIFVIILTHPLKSQVPNEILFGKIAPLNNFRNLSDPDEIQIRTTRNSVNARTTVPTIRYVKAGNPTPVYPYTSWATASDSIQKVVDMCESGDTILIGTGIYRETVVSEHQGRDLAILGVDVDSCIVDLSGFDDNGSSVGLQVNHNIIIKNITIKASNRTTNHIGVLISSQNSSEPSTKIMNNKFLGNFWLAVATFRSTGVIHDNVFLGASTGLQLNIQADSGLLEVGNNLFINNRFAFYGTTGVLRNNLFIDFRISAIEYPQLFASNVKVVNNFFLTNNESAQALFLARGEVMNNIFKVKSVCITPRTSTKPLIFINNIIDSCGTIFDLSNSGVLSGNINYNNFYGYGTISNDISKLDPDTLIYTTFDPMYEGTDSSNYRLQMFSPLIDAGDPTILDVDGTRSDIGRYGGEYGQQYEYLDLAPKVPRFSTVTKKPTGVDLQWRGGTEADFNSFSLHRGREAGFIPDETNRIYTGVDTLFSDSLADPTGSYTYKLKAKDNQGNASKLDSVTVVMTGLAGETNPTPERIYLYQNYPNPFNPSTKIKFSLDSEAEVILRVYDVNGREVAVLQRGMLPAGEYEREFSPVTTGTMSDLASGVYFYNLLVRDKDLKPLFIKTEKMIILK